LPIACGPAGENRFQEIAMLQETGQLEIVRDRELLAGWVESLGTKTEAQRERWKAQAQARLGATRSVLAAIRGAVRDAIRGGSAQSTPGT
jgi:hypothetical protein